MFIYYNSFFDSIILSTRVHKIFMSETITAKSMAEAAIEEEPVNWIFYPKRVCKLRTKVLV